MKKLDPKFIKETCSKHKVDHVLVTSDGQCFLPKAVTHAKFHAFKSKVELFKVTEDGESTPFKEDTVKKAVLKIEKPSSPTGNSNVLPLKKWNKKQLKIRVAELLLVKNIEAPSEDATNKNLVKWIEAAEKVTDKPETSTEDSDSGSEGSDVDSSEGSEDSETENN